METQPCGLRDGMVNVLMGVLRQMNGGVHKGETKRERSSSARLKAELRFRGM